MALISLAIQPGINKEGTLYSNKGGWYFCDKMRFRSGAPEKIGGWQKYLSTALLGQARSILVTADLSGIKNDAVGTNLKYYILRAGTVIDATPLRATDSLGSNPLACTIGSQIVTVTDTANGAAIGDFVTLSGATAFDVFTTGELNQNFQIQSIVDVNNYTINVGVNAGSSTSGGGGSISAAYEIHVGSANQSNGPGWGAGGWSGSQGWGQASDVTVPGNAIRLWTQCTYGQDIIFAPRGGSLYLWDATAPNNRSLAISGISGASDVPTSVTEIIMADNSRQVFAFGCNPIGSAVLDPMLIRFADFENAEMWTPLPSNAAGELRLSAGSKIITAAQSHNEIIVFTDVALYSLQYINYPYYWGATLISTGQSIIGPNAKATVNQTIYWMGVDNFYVYDGHTQVLPSSLKDYVFSNLNQQQTDKIFAGVNSQFNEIWWLYPSATGDGENDSYVVFNYVDNTWYYGTMDRNVWADAGIEQYPIAVSDEGYVYNHELGTDDGSTSPASPIIAYIQSSQLEMDPDGNNFVFANRVIPDITFRPGVGSATTPEVDFYFYPQDYPGADTKTPSDSPVIGAAGATSATIQQFTQQAWIRLRGRSMMFRVQSNNLGVAFRLGMTRLDVRPDGRR